MTVIVYVAITKLIDGSNNHNYMNQDIKKIGKVQNKFKPYAELNKSFC